MTFTVKAGVALPPPAAKRGGKRKYPFHTIEVGGIFFVPDVTTAKLSTYASFQGRQLGRKFRTQKTTMRQDLQTDEWELCSPGAVGARNGVAVCRTA